MDLINSKTSLAITFNFYIYAHPIKKESARVTEIDERMAKKM